jgi:hypothetical protein
VEVPALINYRRYKLGFWGGKKIDRFFGKNFPRPSTTPKNEVRENRVKIKERDYPVWKRINQF